jgi:hypothetical protein
MHYDYTKKKKPVLLIDLENRKTAQIIYTENPDYTKEQLMRNREPDRWKVVVDNYGKFV